MRLRELIESSHQELYSGLPTGNVNARISRIEKILKRKDRVVWYLRWDRILYADELRRKSTVIDDKVLRRFSSAVDPNKTFDQLVPIARAVDLTQLKHFVDTPAEPIQRVNWVRQTPEGLIQELSNAEKKWQKQMTSGNTIEMTDEELDNVLIEFPGEWAWFDLKRASCSDEARAMGHCGNGDTATGMTILSLRKHVRDNLWTPHLTFILDDEGMLGEMKGRNNDKPVPRYHPYIVALLMDDAVKGTKGGGYLPQNNFSILDLDPETRARLLARKPNLWNIYDSYYAWERDKTDQNRFIAEEAFRKDGVLVNLDTFTVTLAEIYDDHIPYVRDAIKFFNDINRHIRYPDDPWDFQQWVKSTYKHEIMEQLFLLYSYGLVDENGDIRFSYNGRVVTMSCSVGAYLRFRDDTDEEGNPQKIGTDKRSDYDDGITDHFFEQIEDKTIELLLRFIMNESPNIEKLERDLVAEFEGLSSVPKVAYPHRDQLSLKL